jgi:hypothetical protein
LTVLRTTAPPTARLTIRPTLAGSWQPGLTSKCPDTSERPALLPLRMASPKSALRRILAAAGSMTLARARPSDADALAALAPARRQDGAARAGPHPQPETMGLRPAPVIRLKSTLAHWNSRCGRFVSGCRTQARSSVRLGQQPLANSDAGEFSEWPYLRQAAT